MSFKLINTPAIFQTYINNILREHLDVFVVIYLDDILFYSKNKADHKVHVRKILQALKKADLQIKSEKSQFYWTEIEFLSYIIINKSIKMNSEKVRVIAEWSVPKSVKDVQFFLKFVNFYQKFIKKYSHVTASLTDIIRKKQEIHWEEKTQETFKRLKQQFAEESILQMFNSKRLTVMKTDASD